MKARYGAALVAVGVLALAGCGNQTVRDLEGVPIQDPEKIDLTVNVDQFANVVSICIHGEGFVATTRDNSPAALMHIPEWSATKDGWCAN